VIDGPFVIAVVIFSWGCGGNSVHELVYRRNPGAASRWARRTVFLNSTLIIISLPDWSSVAVLAILTLPFLWIWLRGGGRGRRKRSLKSLGHKARAKLAELARRMPKPWLAREPVPA
jgi:hypothetical protein